VLETVLQHGIALVVSTHDERIAARFGARWTVRDGSLLAAHADRHWAVRA
jgi:predicted ABC-type transport system involved in lysophospholipase L1 biosynthesis ATPase subunit